MGVSTTTNRVTYSGDGSSAVFAFQYEFHSTSDLLVITYNSSRTTAISQKFINTDFTISGVQDAQNRYTNGANVIFNSSPSATDSIIIVREMSVINPFLLKFNQVLPNAELMKALDRITLIEQRYQDLSTRSVRLKDGYPYTFNPRLPERLVKGAPLIVGSSGLTIEMGVAAVAGSSAAAYFGILPVPNGGTGLDFSAVQGIIYSPGNNTTFSNINNGTPTQVLTSNGSSAPTFQSFAVTLINSGTIAVAFGGTGANSFSTNGVIIGSGTTQYTSVVGGTDQPLIGNTGAPPSFKPLNMASGSSVTGILPMANGGIGVTNTSFPQFSILYMAQPNQVGVVAPGGVGQILVSNGAAPPSYSSGQPKSQSFFTDLSSETLTNITDVAYLSGSSGILEAYNTSGNNGKELTIQHMGSSYVQQYTFTAATSNLIIAMGKPAPVTSYTVHSFGEQAKFTIFGSTWFQTSHIAVTPKEMYTPATTNGFGTIASSFLTRQRSGEFFEFSGYFIAGTPTAAEAQISFNKLGAGESLLSSSIVVIEPIGITGRVSALQGPIHITAEPGVGYLTVSVQTAGAGIYTKQLANAIWAAGDKVAVTGRVLVAGWNP